MCLLCLLVCFHSKPSQIRDKADKLRCADNYDNESAADDDDVMDLSRYVNSLISTKRKRRMQFVGHINRKDNLEKILTWKIAGKGSRERQRLA